MAALRLSLLLRSMYLIYKETLHNVLKHAAGGPPVRVQLALVASRLQLTVSNEVAPVPAHRRVSGAGGAAAGRLAGRWP